MKLIQNEKSLSIVKIRPYHGREFVNFLIKQYCENNGILHQLSVVRMSQQNVVVEKRNRTLKEVGRTMTVE